MESLNNQQFIALIKLRHLSKAVRSDWEMLGKSKTTVGTLLREARIVMDEMGTSSGKSEFETDLFSLNQLISTVQDQLNILDAFIRDSTPKGEKVHEAWIVFSTAVDAAMDKFVQIMEYPSSYFIDDEALKTWKEVWHVVQSYLYSIRGIGEAALVKIKIAQNFTQNEASQLLNNIARHIPDSFNLLDANRYLSDYIQAAKEIEEESGKDGNLWDRFLNFLAGNIPFKQTPEERVMMRRWLEGELGEL